MFRDEFSRWLKDNPNRRSCVNIQSCLLCSTIQFSKCNGKSTNCLMTRKLIIRRKIFSHNFISIKFVSRVWSMKSTPPIIRLCSSHSSKIVLKLSTLSILLLLCYSMVSTFFAVDRVPLPEGCARACPPQRDPSRFICARNTATGKLGMFDSECFFGRYNHCVHVDQRKQLNSFQLTQLLINIFLSAYSFVRYGNCQSIDF